MERKVAVPVALAVFVFAVVLLGCGNPSSPAEPTPVPGGQEGTPTPAGAPSGGGGGTGGEESGLLAAYRNTVALESFKAEAESYDWISTSTVSHTYLLHARDSSHYLFKDVRFDGSEEFINSWSIRNGDGLHSYRPNALTGSYEWKEYSSSDSADAYLFSPTQFAADRISILMPLTGAYNVVDEELSDEWQAATLVGDESYNGVPAKHYRIEWTETMNDGHAVITTSVDAYVATVSGKEYIIGAERAEESKVDGERTMYSSGNYTISEIGTANPDLSVPS